MAAALLIYLSLSVALGAATAIWGVGAIDEHARDAGWGFRLLIAPGCALFWPYLLIRWRIALRSRQ